MAKTTGIVIGVLLLVIIVLIGFLVYAFVVRPAVTGYSVGKQMEGAEWAIVSIMQQATTCQPVPLTYRNQTINMMWIDGCFDQACLGQCFKPSQQTQPQE